MSGVKKTAERVMGYYRNSYANRKLSNHIICDVALFLLPGRSKVPRTVTLGFITISYLDVS